MIVFDLLDALSVVRTPNLAQNITWDVLISKHFRIHSKAFALLVLTLHTRESLNNRAENMRAG